MMHHYLSCKLAFDLQINNKLHILNIDYYKLKFQNFLKPYFEIKILQLYAKKKIASHLTIHLHK
jgi:hypothetical protein